MGMFGLFIFCLFGLMLSCDQDNIDTLMLYHLIGALYMKFEFNWPVVSKLNIIRYTVGSSV